MSIAFYFLIADFPEEAKWLTPEEKAFVKARLEDDVGESGIDTQMDPKLIIKTLTNCMSFHMVLSLIFPLYSPLVQIKRFWEGSCISD